MAPPTTTAATRPARPLRRVLTLRLAVTGAVAFALLAGLLAGIHTTQQQQAARQLLADAERHYRSRTRQIDAEWVRQADLLRAQIEFSGALDGADQRLSRSRLTALLASMGGQGAFTHVLLQGSTGERLFSFGTRSRAAMQPQGTAALGWTFSPEDRLLYRTLRAPLRLGKLGTVVLVVFAPVDNALLAANAFPNSALSLDWSDQGDLATSYAGASPHGTVRGPVIRLEGKVRWADDPATPQLRVVRDVQPVMALAELLAMVLLGGLLVLGLGWLVLGRWARDHVRRIGVLAGGAARFAQGRRLTPGLRVDLDGAIDHASNELHALGSGLKSLMQGWPRPRLHS